MRETFTRVRNHLSALGIEFYCDLNPVATMRDIDEANGQLGRTLPDSYVEVVTEFANGFQLSWRIKDGPFAAFEMETLESSTEGMLGMPNWRLYDDAAAQEYGFPHTEDSELAMRTNQRMHHWFPFHQVGNGDYFSIDMNEDRFGSVILDQHDWLDGGTGDNGFIMASDLPSFLKAWGNVCFAQPKTLWWKSVIGSDGIAWDSDQFDDRFHINQ